jgi:hypothetical protein
LAEGLVIPMTMTSQRQQLEDRKINDERRRFIERCGKFAAVTPPAMALLLAVSAVPEEAEASSWHHRRSNGGGNGDSGRNGNGNRWGD